MSHADIIRRLLSYPAPTLVEREQALAALDALVTENQRLRDALEQIAGGFSGGWRTTVAQKALDGTPSAAQTLEDPTPHKEKEASSHGS